MGHLGNLGLSDTTKTCKQLQVLTASQQLENGIRLRAVTHVAVCGAWFLGHAEDGGQGVQGTG